jgi:hypothetical protein
MMKQLSDKELAALELKYGKVKQLFYNKIGTGAIWYVLRKPSFDEYITFNKYITNIAPPNTPPKYEVDAEIAAVLLSKIIILPEDIDVSTIPPGIIIDSAIHAINLYDFEDNIKLREMYVGAIKNAHTIVGSIIQRILSMYGVQGYLAIKQMSEQEIIDMLVYSEVINGDLGTFAQLTQMQDIPIIKKGKTTTIDLNRLLNIETGSPQEPVLSKKEQTRRTQLTNHYKQLGYSDKQIADILNKRANEQTFESVEALRDQFKKVDTNNLDLSKVTKDEWDTLRKEGKVPDFKESQQMAFAKSKAALQEQIENDRLQFGERKKTNNFTGDLNRLLQEVKQKTRDME